MIHAANLPPLNEIPRDWVPSSANVSFKRAVIPEGNRPRKGVRLDLEVLPVGRLDAALQLL